MTVGPGRELDALVAEKVMGWSSEELDEDVGICVPRYSTDISAAWEVVEKLGEKFEQFDLQFGWNTGRFVCGFGSFGTSRFESTPTEFAPHAICLAALRAVGYDVPT